MYEITMNAENLFSYILIHYEFIFVNMKLYVNSKYHGFWPFFIEEIIFEIISEE